MNTTLLVGVAGFLGAISRYTLNNLLITNLSFPVHTFIINILGTLILALINLLLSKKIDSNISTAISVGFCGAFTTFSTFSFEIFKLIEKGQILTALIYISLSIITSLICIFLIYKISY